MQATHTQRPVGLTVLAALVSVFGILGVLQALSILAGSAVVGSRDNDVQLMGVLLTHGSVQLVMSALQVAFGYGLWTLRPWAWTLGVAIQVVSIALALVYLFMGASLLGQAVTSVIPAAILIYLFTPGVRRALGKA